MRQSKKPKKGRTSVPVTGRKPAAKTVPAISADGLTPQLQEFVRLYNVYLGNGTRAYEESHPANASKGAAAVGASKALRNPKVRAAVDRDREKRWTRMAMQGDEALALIAQDARADIRKLFDDKGKLLDPNDWPDDVALSIESVDIANGKIKLVPKAAARRIVLEQTGKLKGIGSGIDSLARLLAGDFDQEKEA